MSQRLAGKIAFVSGAASGIGLGVVERFVAEGAKVVAADLQDEKGAALETRFKGAVIYRHCDVTDPAQLAAAIGTGPEQFGGLDICINNAGAGGTMSGIEDADIDGWRKAYELLLFSVVTATKIATPFLKARGGGAIINTSSISALEAGWAPVAYSCAKSGVMHFSRLAAAELSQHKIRINAVLPGFIATSIFGTSLGMERPAADQMAAMLVQAGAKMQPMGRVGQPSDIAGACAFLASDDGAWITGTHLIVDGGITIGPRSAWDTTAASPLLDALGISPEQAEAMRAAQLAAAKG